MDEKFKKKQAQKVTIIWAVGDLILGILKIFVGKLFNSSALIADGIHSFSDLVTDFFVIIISQFAHEKPDANHPYGHGRFETLGTVILGSVLIGVGFLLIYENARDLWVGTVQVNPGWPTLGAALLSIIIKEAAYQHTVKVGKQINSPMIIANAWHSRTDAISSVVVLIGLSLSFLGYPWLDEVVAMIVAVFIGKIGWDFLWSSVKELLETSLPAETVQKINEEILKVDGVRSTHNLRTRKVGERVVLDVNIEVSPLLSVSEGHEIASWVAKNLIKNFKDIEDVTVHTDVEDDRIGENIFSVEKKNLLPLRKEVVGRVMQELSDYDLNHLKEIRLHYINGKIKFEFFFPEHVVNDANFEQMLNEKCSNIPWFDKIICWYAK